MTTDGDGNGFGIIRRIRRTGVVLLIAAAACLLASAGPAWLTERASAQSANQRMSVAQVGYVGYQVLFEFTADDKALGGTSVDQITVIFSNRSVEGPAAPVPFFGDDILQEFSFSAMNVVNGQFRFSRRVRDKSFVDATYIRVVNHGTNGWAGDKISLTVDGEPILRAVGMYPRHGAAGINPRGGIEKFNPKDWAGRSYWESSLQQYRGAVKR
jgi:hypothetical protein